MACENCGRPRAPMGLDYSRTRDESQCWADVTRNDADRLDCERAKSERLEGELASAAEVVDDHERGHVMLTALIEEMGRDRDAAVERAEKAEGERDDARGRAANNLKTAMRLADERRAEATRADALAEALQPFLSSTAPYQQVTGYADDGPNEPKEIVDGWTCCLCMEGGDTAETIEHAEGCDYERAVVVVAAHRKARGQ